ncbi:hypothetical protein GIB67_007810 [Kingdonia uniflora]|uniref:BTB/POZ and MATH domain-containing protein 3 n=1 Tax=Kingdonia uniflora TaxID=39325 RepID=A0A7J7N1U6_9MAGN|nr:hypothetical protein GIB67_007810 [Kingdonia uniflora]
MAKTTETLIADTGRKSGSILNPLEDSCSNSRSISDTVNGSHEYTITGYSLAKGMGVGKYISSSTFTIGGQEWAIYFYPDGKNPEDNSVYVSVFIALAGNGTDVRALFELTLLDQSGKERHKVHSHFDRSLESGPYTLKYRGSMWGYKRFYKRTMLESSDFLKDDCLSMRCTVGVVRNRTEGPKHFTITVPPSDIGQNLKKIFESGLGSDITFEVGEETFKAHKLVLAARSPVFRAQFFAVMKSEGFGHLEQSCPSLLSDLLEAIAEVDEEPSLVSSKKRSGSVNSTIGLHVEQSVDASGRRTRRRNS